MDELHAFMARSNFRDLSRNPYPGRGIIMAIDEKAKNLIQIYWIMGRSISSRNRIFVSEGGSLRTMLADPSKSKGVDTSLILYNAMAEQDNLFAVSNGNQTDIVLKKPDVVRFQDALENYSYEPDSPNFTPRITAIWMFEFGFKPLAKISILSKSPFGEECDRFFYLYRNIPAGYGFCVHTYKGDGNPLPSFTDNPYLLPVKGEPEKILDEYWNALNEDNRVSLAVKTIPIAYPHKSSILIINRYKRS